MAGAGQSACISAVVVSYRTGPSLTDCIDALAVAAEVLDIIVVDNGNDDVCRAVLERAQQRYPQVRVLQPRCNLGFAAGCNLGAAAARGRYVALVNPDLIAPPGTFATILRALDNHPDAWLCGGRLLNMNGSEQRGGRRDIVTPWRALVEVLRLDALFPNHPYFGRINLHSAPPITDEATVPVVSGAFMVFPVERWNSLGGLDEGMFLHMEDVDICLRIHLAGGQVLYCGSAPVYHHQGTSAAPAIWVEWHKVRSAIYYFRKHFRGTYPDWALTIIAAALWGRFALLPLKMASHLLRHGRPKH